MLPYFLVYSLRILNNSHYFIPTFIPFKTSNTNRNNLHSIINSNQLLKFIRNYDKLYDKSVTTIKSMELKLIGSIYLRLGTFPKNVTFNVEKDKHLKSF